MRVSFENFGPLRKFEMDLQSDFSIIVGDNNIGKSYAISLLYAIIKNFLSNNEIVRPYFGEFFFEKIFEKADDGWRESFSKFYKTSSVKNIDITEYVSELARATAEFSFGEQLQKSIEGTFGDISNLENRRNDGDTTIQIATSDLSIGLKIVNGRLLVHSMTTPSEIIFRKSKQHRKAKQIGSKTVIYGPEDNLEQAEFSVFYAAMNRIRNFIQEVAGSISDVHYLPASRSGLYQALSAFGQIIAELSKRRTFLSQRIELPAISEPLVDYFLKLNEIRPPRKGHESNFHSVAEELERKLLGGAVEFDQKSKKLFYKPFDVNLKLDLSSTSSMVSEVAPIVTYLKHVLPDVEQRRGARRVTKNRPAEQVKRKQIIFIEEPEAHLHPRSQVLLIDAFARLVRESDVKLVMTSHSNFVFNKVSNVVISGGFGNARIEAFRFVRGEKGTVSKRLDVDGYGISDENFSEVAEDLFSERVELLEKEDCEQEASNDF